MITKLKNRSVPIRVKGFKSIFNTNMMIKNKLSVEAPIAIAIFSLKIDVQFCSFASIKPTNVSIEIT